MATTTDRPSAAELRQQKEERVAREQAEMAEARKNAEADAAARETETAAGENGSRDVDAQYGLFDQVIENEELEAALEEREKVNNSRKALNAKFKTADTEAKGLISALDLSADDVVRCGRFRIKLSEVAGRSVAFETDPAERLTISLLDD